MPEDEPSGMNEPSGGFHPRSRSVRPNEAGCTARSVPFEHDPDDNEETPVMKHTLAFLAALPLIASTGQPDEPAATHEPSALDADQ